MIASPALHAFAEIDRVGCFKYEPVAGASSNAIGDAVPEPIKQERWNALMARQQTISARRLKRKVGSRQQIIIDEVGPTVAKGRSKADAPEIDGAVYLSSRRPLKVGEIVTAKIERADELPPFAVWPAFPTSDYYGGSASLHIIGDTLP